MRPWKPILAALVIFAAGAAIGRFSLRPTISASEETSPPSSREGRPGSDRRGGQPGRPPWSPVLSADQIAGICSRMMQDLDLTLVQSNQVATILQDSQARMKAIADDYLPRTREEFHRTREAIKGVLTESQLQKFEEGFRKRQDRWGRRGADQPPPDEDHRDRRRGSPSPDTAPDDPVEAP